MGTVYGRVLARRDVRAVLGPYVLSRLPLSMNLLALLILVRSTSGSYAQAGVACAVYGIAAACTGPVLGRWVDRHGQARVLLVTGLLHPAATLGLVLIVRAHLSPVIPVAAGLVGACVPPMSSCMRVLWGRLLPGDDESRAGYAIEAVVVETAELIGPLLVTAGLALGSAAIALAAGGIMSGVGALLFRRTAASRAATGSARDTDWRGALAVPGVRVLLLVVMVSTAMTGMVEVAVAAFARTHGGSVSTGAYVALLAVGGIVGGLLAGSGRWLKGRQAPGMLAVLLLAAGAGSALPASAHSIGTMALSLFIAGSCLAPCLVVELGMMAATAPEGIRTEAFTWGLAANLLGLAAGNLVAGELVSRSGLSSPFLLAGGAGALAALVAVFGGRHLRRDGQHATVPAESAAQVSIEALTETSTEVPAEVPAEVSELVTLRERVAQLEEELARAIEQYTLSDAREVERRMLERADDACLAMRERAEDDAARVREAATVAALEIMSSAERDARAIYARARRIAPVAPVVPPAPDRDEEADELTSAPYRRPSRTLLVAVPDATDRQEHDGPDALEQTAT